MPLQAHAPGMLDMAAQVASPPGLLHVGHAKQLFLHASPTVIFTPAALVRVSCGLSQKARSVTIALQAALRSSHPAEAGGAVAAMASASAASAAKTAGGFRRRRRWCRCRCGVGVGAIVVARPAKARAPSSQPTGRPAGGDCARRGCIAHPPRAFRDPLGARQHRRGALGPPLPRRPLPT